MAPAPCVGMKPMMARRAVRMLQEGCQDSGWCPLMLRQIFLFVSKRPFGWSSNEALVEGKEMAGKRVRER